MMVCLFLSRLAGNGLGAEGVKILLEPLGKLTALVMFVIAREFFVVFLD